MTEARNTFDIAKEFVSKLNADKFDFSKPENSDQQKIIHDLLNDVDIFEKARKERQNEALSQELFGNTNRIRHPMKYSMTDATSNLLKLMRLAKINKLYTEHDEENNPTIKSLRNLNSKLINQKDQLQNVVNKIFEEYPRIKEKYKPLLGTIKIEEGKIE